MAAVTFDTLAYSDTLQKAGVPREQAEAFAKANAEAFNAMANTRQLATKQDIEIVRREIDGVRREIETNKHEILKWMVAGMVAQAALLVAIIAFLK